MLNDNVVDFYMYFKDWVTNKHLRYVYGLRQSTDYKKNVSDYVIELRRKTKFYNKRIKLYGWPPSLRKWNKYMFLSP